MAPYIKESLGKLIYKALSGEPWYIAEEIVMFDKIVYTDNYDIYYIA